MLTHVISPHQVTPPGCYVRFGSVMIGPQIYYSLFKKTDSSRIRSILSESQTLRWILNLTRSPPITAPLRPALYFALSLLFVLVNPPLRRNADYIPHRSLFPFDISL